MQTGIANQRCPFEVCGRENIPGNPSACTTRYFTYLVRGPLHIHHFNSIISHKGDVHVRIYQTSNVNRSSSTHYNTFNTLRPRQHGPHFADDTFKCIFLNENVWIPIKISLKFVPKGPINNIPALVQIMAWRRPGDKPFSEPMMVSIPTHIRVARPQWVNVISDHYNIHFQREMRITLYWLHLSVIEHRLIGRLTASSKPVQTNSK